MITRITIVGAGYVGMSLSVLLAKYNEVLVHDIHEGRVALINDRKSTIKNNLIDKFLDERPLNLRATSSPKEAYRDADLIIVATPTGSTAYALSAGGSIIHPELNIWNIIPMMSQSLSSRPLIVSNKKSMEIQLIRGPLEHAMVCVDGQKDIPIPYNESIHITKKDLALEIIHPSNNNFYEACREKLGWSLDITVKKPQ